MCRFIEEFTTSVGDGSDDSPRMEVQCLVMQKVRCRSCRALNQSCSCRCQVGQNVSSARKKRESGNFRPAEAAELGLEMFDALRDFHAITRFVHRDIKPVRCSRGFRLIIRVVACCSRIL